MKTKFLLPVLAMIVAIGMSFTTANSSNNPTTDYIFVDGDFQDLEMELNCGTGNVDCQVELEEDGQPHFVYDDDDLLTRKKGSGVIIRLWDE